MTTPEQKDIIVSRVLNASIDQAWKAWTDPALVMQWWAPDHFTSPSAKIDFRDGGLSIVCMRAPKEMGGQDMYSTWKYVKIVPGASIEFIHNLSDKDGVTIDPASIGMPADFPRNMRMEATFTDGGDGTGAKTEVTVRQYGWMTGQMRDMGEAGLNQSMDKMAAIFNTKN
jgi:uncharacterized protein YndB with AHSA1/START domain